MQVGAFRNSGVIGNRDLLSNGNPGSYGDCGAAEMAIQGNQAVIVFYFDIISGGMVETRTDDLSVAQRVQSRSARDGKIDPVMESPAVQLFRTELGCCIFRHRSTRCGSEAAILLGGHVPPGGGSHQWPF